MARLASESKAGFYATPPEEMMYVLQSLFIAECDEEKTFNLYDPCCGNAEALSMLTEELKRNGVTKTRSYGSEIEEGRFEAAQQSIDYVLHEGYQFVRTEPLFSLLWLNPPYQKNFSERAELTFLRALTGSKQGVLMKGGILLFCVPQYVIKDTAGILSGRFENIEVYRFTDDNYDVFKQVVVIGRMGRSSAAEQKKTYKKLVAIGEGERDMLPTLEEMNAIRILPCPVDNEPMFRAGPLNPEEMAADLEKSSLFDEITRRLIPKSSAATMKRPMLPLKPAHMGTALAAGAVGGNMGSHIISGITKQRVDSEAMYNDEGNYEGERKTYHFATVIRSFTPDGTFDLV